MWPFEILASIALSALVVSTQAIAGSSRYHDDGYYVNAEVVRVEPIVRIVEVMVPYEACWNERVRHVDYGRRAGRNSPVPMIVGGVVGGVVGNRVGKRRHRNVLTIAGTLIGAAVGRSVSGDSRRYRQSRRYPTTERHCETRTEYHEEERIDGYDVTYRYHGRNFTTRTDDAPGRYIRLQVQVEPTLDSEQLTDGERWHRGRVSDCGDACADTWM